MVLCPEGSRVKDPVCGMDVKDGGDMLLHKGRRYVFCCATCRWAFERDPDRYGS